MTIRQLARVLRDGAAWRRGHAQFLLRQVYNRRRNASRSYTDREHLVAAAEWLERAQDATGDNGVCGRYDLGVGWTSSYPETTGYIIPTFLRLGEEIDGRFRDRARRAVEFLLPLQLESGAFPGMEIAENRADPSPFNTAQIIHGLLAWHRATGDSLALVAARRAGDWLVSMQDEDGAFRKHSYLNVATAYFAHASCWIAELGEFLKDDRYLSAAGRHLDWVLGRVDEETGWVDGAGFGKEDHEARQAVTHTIAYTLWGILFTSEVLGREDGLAVVRRAADAIARRLALSRRLPGILDRKWRRRGNFACLTGNAQMALVWFRLHAHQANPRFVNAALGALDLVKEGQPMDNPNPGICGGVAGSDPVWGDYIYMALPNWAAKYFVDGLIAKEDVLSALRDRRPGGWQLPTSVPTALPPLPAKAMAPLKVVLYTTPGSRKPAQMLRMWSSWGFRPDAIVVERKGQQPVWKRLRQRLRQDGLLPLVRRLWTLGGAPAASDAPDTPPADAGAVQLAHHEGVEVVEVESINSPEALEALRTLEPDLAVHAGAGILRAPLLAIPRLGTLNAHMGLLPCYRGMNVAEWAAFQQDPVGCTVHLIDPGIDTGGILCARSVDVTRVSSIGELRARVDQAQIELLGDVVRYVVATGRLPTVVSNPPHAGVQFFRMHRDLVALLESELESKYTPNGAGAEPV